MEGRSNKKGRKAEGKKRNKGINVLIFDVGTENGKHGWMHNKTRAKNERGEQ